MEQVYTVDFMGPCYYNSSLTIEVLAESNEDIYRQLQQHPLFKKLTIRPYLNHLNLSKSYGTSDKGAYDVHCKVCDIVMTYQSFVETESSHIHDDYKYTTEEYQEHIRLNTVIHAGNHRILMLPKTQLVTSGAVIIGHINKNVEPEQKRRKLNESDL